MVRLVVEAERFDAIQARAPAAGSNARCRPGREGFLKVRQQGLAQIEEVKVEGETGAGRRIQAI
jgi:hypothetical protein